MTKDFSNSVILPDDLPAIKPTEFNPIDRKYLKLIYIRLTISAAIMALSGLGFHLISKEDFPNFTPWILSGILAVTFCSSFIITYISFPYRGYLIREKDIAYKRGLIKFKLTSIPFSRIQHVELIQGVISKQMNLASIKIYTAGGSSDDLSIPCVPIETAKQIREFLTGKISSDE